jgi:spoIIIJ-associated protein
MKKIEAKTLEEAYAKAAKLFDCSVTDLEYEIVQHPSSGFLGFGARKAVIVAACKTPTPSPSPAASSVPQSTHPAPSKAVKPAPQPTKPAPEPVDHATQTPERSAPVTDPSEAAILGGFFDEKTEKDLPAPAVQASEASPDEKELGPMIEEKLSTLIRSTCFNIDTVEVDVIDGTAYIFIDGDDAALLIGKEGYRYNALSYLLYNWLHNEYGLFIKLEIAQFLASQQEMIRNYIQPVIEHVHQSGWGKTRPLDGILVQIALEQLREEFPDKYVAIKRTRDGERYILINKFNKR